MRLLDEKMGKQDLNNDEEEADQSVKDETEPRVVPNKAITHKEVAEMHAKVWADATFKKKAHAQKYLPEMDLVPFPPKF